LKTIREGLDMRRRRVLVLLAVACVLVRAAVALLPAPSRNTIENHYRIRQGMSRAEVDSILGPPGDYSSGPLQYAGSPGGPTVAFTPTALEPFVGIALERVEWRGDRHIVWVYFEPDGNVLHKRTREVGRTNQSLLENFFWRAKRQWQRWFP
jgi:hypothetical protein